MPATKRNRTRYQSFSSVSKRRVKSVRNSCEMQALDEFGSSSSKSTMTESTCPSEKDSPDEEYQESSKTLRFESFQPYLRGKRKNYVRSTSKMSLSRRLSYKISKSDPQTPIRALQITFTPSTIGGVTENPVAISVQSQVKKSKASKKKR